MSYVYVVAKVTTHGFLKIIKLRMQFSPIQKKAQAIEAKISASNF